MREAFRPADYIVGAAVMNIALATTTVIQPYISTLKSYSLAGPVGSLLSGVGLLLLGYYFKRIGRDQGGASPS